MNRLPSHPFAFLGDMCMHVYVSVVLLCGWEVFLGGAVGMLLAEREESQKIIASAYHSFRVKKF